MMDIVHDIETKSANISGERIENISELLSPKQIRFLLGDYSEVLPNCSEDLLHKAFAKLPKDAFDFENGIFFKDGHLINIDRNVSQDTSKLSEGVQTGQMVITVSELVGEGDDAHRVGITAAAYNYEERDDKSAVGALAKDSVTNGKPADNSIKHTEGAAAQDSSLPEGTFIIKEINGKTMTLTVDNAIDVKAAFNNAKSHLRHADRDHPYRGNHGAWVGHGF